MRLFILTVIMAIFISPVMAGDGITTTLDAETDIEAFAVVSGDGKAGEPFYGCINLYGTFNSATVHWLFSTDDGTTKSPMRNISGTAVTSTAADSFCFNWGFSALSTTDQTIFYASVSGAASAPALTIDLFDNR